MPPKAKALDGIVDVVQTPRGVAVVGRDMWTAMKGRELVTVEWDDAEGRTARLGRNPGGIPQAGERPGRSHRAQRRRRGGGAWRRRPRTIEAQYEFPYLAHASLEPLNAIARMDERRRDRGLGRPPDARPLPGGRRAGRRRHAGQGQAARHEDRRQLRPPRRRRCRPRRRGRRHGRARSAGKRRSRCSGPARTTCAAAATGRPMCMPSRRGSTRTASWSRFSDHIVGQSIMGGSPFAAMIKDGVDPTSVEGAANLPYAIPNLKIDLTTTELKMPVLWWRSVGSTHTAYVDRDVHRRARRGRQARSGRVPPVHARQASAARRRAEACRREGGLGREAAGRPFPRRGAARELLRPSSPRWSRSPSRAAAISRSIASSARSIAASRSIPTRSAPRWKAASASVSGRSCRRS